MTGTDDGDLAFRPVHGLARDLAGGTVTAEEFARACIDRIERHGEALHAFVTVYADEALMAARAADIARASGNPVGPLHGLPVAVKDIIDIEGRVTTGGSAHWRERVSPHTATLVTRLRAAGLAVIGKTHTVEFAMGSFGTNRHLGTPRNPWDPAAHRAPGGSSAGSAVAVAAGLAPWAIGTDTGGSVRLPAAWCGLVGLKTTIGRISTHGVLPLSTTLDTPGPICRSVRDAALLYDAMRGPDPLDRSTFACPPDRSRRALDQGVEGLHLARVPATELAAAEPEVRALYESSVELLAALGAHIVEVELPVSFEEMGAMTGRIIGAEGYSFVGHLVDDPGLPIDDDVRPRIQLGRDMSAQEYLATLQAQQQVKRDYERALAQVDALLTPGVAQFAPPIDAIDQRGTAALYTRPFNLIEWCALALPNGFGESGLPSSLQIACRGGDEEMALRIGAAYESATGWSERRPPGLD